MDLKLERAGTKTEENESFPSFTRGLPRSFWCMFSGSHSLMAHIGKDHPQREKEEERGVSARYIFAGYQKRAILQG